MTIYGRNLLVMVIFCELLQKIYASELGVRRSINGSRKAIHMRGRNFRHLSGEKSNKFPGIFLHIQNVKKEGFHMVYNLYIFLEYYLLNRAVDYASRPYDKMWPNL